MIYTPYTIKAMKLAYDAHQGQLDKGGVPYIFHPYHLAEQMTDEITTCAALLHDVVEDTAVTMDELSLEFPSEVIDVLRLLTHDKHIAYFDYVHAIKSNEAAVKVKLADIAHNADETRLDSAKNVAEDKKLHWQSKYKKAREILEGRN